MFLDDFHSVQDGTIRITARQGSRFAKEVAGDFNPIHDPDAKRFCVPGDLLFALVLARYGLSTRMRFGFRGMLGDDVAIRFRESGSGTLDIVDAGGKVYLEVERAGPIIRGEEVVEAFTRRYVAFSARNFPHFLKPLMAEKGVMFNPDRPLVIYDSMSFELRNLDLDSPVMELANATLDVSGKRGDALIAFDIVAAGERVGGGSKKLILSGLRAYDEERLQDFIAEFTRRMEDYRAGY